LGLDAVLAGVSGLIFGLSFAPRLWLDAPCDPSEVSTPRISVKQDRTAAVSLGVTFAMSFGLASGLAFTVNVGVALGYAHELVGLLVGAVGGALAGAFGGYVAYGRTGLLTFGAAGASAGALAFLPVSNTSASGVLTIFYGVMFGLSAGLLGLLSRAWGRFVVAHFWLALWGRVPWRLMRFLEDAHRRGVLRQSGALYEFRHERLRDHLAMPIT
jgi:hypothetical protein